MTKYIESFDEGIVECKCCNPPHYFKTSNIVEDLDEYFVLECPKTKKLYNAEYDKVVYQLIEADE